MASWLAALARWSHHHPVAVATATAFVLAGLLGGLAVADTSSPIAALSTDGLPAQATLDRIDSVWGAVRPAFLYIEEVDASEADTLRAVAQATHRLLALPDVVAVRSVTHTLEQAVGPLADADDAEIEQAFGALPERERQEFVAGDVIVLRVDVREAADGERLLASFRAIAQQMPGDAYPAGPVFTDVHLQRSAQRELSLVLPATAGVLLLLLAFFYRRPLDTLVPLLTVGVALGMAVGVLAWSGLPLNMQSLLVLPLLMGLGVDYMFHIVYPLRDLDPLQPLGDRFASVARHDGAPIAYAAMTTMIGFGSFLLSPVPLIRSWGLLVGAGVGLSFLLGFTLMPALYRLHRPRMSSPRLPLGVVMRRVGDFAVRRRRGVLAATVGATGVLLACSLLLDYEPTLEFDPPDTAEQRAMEALDSRFGGQVVGQYLLREPSLVELEKLELRLRGIPEIVHVNGPATRLAQHGGDLEGPATHGLVAGGYARVLFTYAEADGKAVLSQLTDPEFDAGRAVLTGQGLVQLQAQEAMLRGIITSIGVSFVLVALLLLAVHRIPVLAAMAFAPLLVAIVWQLGIQALLQIPFNPITGLMTAMILGVGVDFSVHVVGHYRQHRAHGMRRDDAAREAVGGVGRPIVAATITTTGAFAVLSFSSAAPLRQFGAVAMIAVLSAVVITMVALPAALAIGAGKETGRPGRVPAGAAAGSGRSRVPGSSAAVSERSSVPGGAAAGSGRSRIPDGAGSGRSRNPDGAGSGRSAMPGPAEPRPPVPRMPGARHGEPRVPGMAGSEPQEPRVPGTLGAGTRRPFTTVQPRFQDPAVAAWHADASGAKEPPPGGATMLPVPSPAAPEAPAASADPGPEPAGPSRRRGRKPGAAADTRPSRPG